MPSKERVLIEIKSEADVTNIKALKQALEGAIVSAKAVSKPTLQYEKRLKSVEKALTGTTAKEIAHAAAQRKVSAATAATTKRTGFLMKSLGDAQSAFSQAGGGAMGFASALGSIVKSPVIAVLVGIIAAIKLATFSLREYGASEQVVAGLDQALSKQANLTDELRERYQALANQMQSSTAIANDEWLKSLTKLSQFGMDPAAAEDYMEAIKNLAGLYDGDLKRSTEAVSKAMKGQFEAFREAGIVIDMTKTQGDKMTDLFTELRTMGGGALEARAKTLGGLFRNLGNSLSDFGKAIGSWMGQAGLMQAALGGLITTFDYWAVAIMAVMPQLDALENGLAANRTGTLNLMDAQRAQKDATEEQARAIEKSNDEFTRRLGILAQAKAAEDKLAEAQKRAAMAILERQREENIITQAQFDTKRLGIEQRFDRGRIQRDQTAENREAVELQKQREEMQATLAAVRGGEAQAEKDLEVVSDAQGGRADVQAMRRRQRAAMQQAQDAAQVVTDLTRRQETEGSTRRSVGPSGRAVGVSDREIAAAQQEADRTQRRVRSMRPAIDEAIDKDKILSALLEKMGLKTGDQDVDLGMVSEAAGELEVARSVREGNEAKLVQAIKDLTRRMEDLGRSGETRREEFRLQAIEQQARQDILRSQQGRGQAEAIQRENAGGGDIVEFNGQNLSQAVPTVDVSGMVSELEERGNRLVAGIDRLQGANEMAFELIAGRVDLLTARQDEIAQQVKDQQTA